MTNKGERHYMCNVKGLVSCDLMELMYLQRRMGLKRIAKPSINVFSTSNWLLFLKAVWTKAVVSE